MKKVMFMLLTFLLLCSAAAAQESDLELAPNPFFMAQGIYSIGTTSFTWQTKESLNEKYVGQIWYPAEKTDNQLKARYLPAAVYEKGLDIQEPLLTALRSVTTDAGIDAPVLQEKKRYPVLIFSPELRMMRQSDTFLFEYLASRGFIVAAVDHPGSSLLTEKADGAFIPYNQTADYTSPAAKTKLALQRSSQLSSVLDALLALNHNPDSMFYKKISSKRIGVFGHSLGGRSALRACSLDKRFKAAVNLDGSLEGEAPYNFAKQQVLQITVDFDEQLRENLVKKALNSAQASALEQEHQLYLNNLFSSTNAKVYLVYLANTAHANYTDLPLLFKYPQKAHTSIGSANGRMALISVGKLLESFFSESFNNTASFETKIQQYPYTELKRTKNSFANANNDFTS